MTQRRDGALIVLNLRIERFVESEPHINLPAYISLINLKYF